MAKYVPNIKTRRFVIISPKRIGRPKQKISKPSLKNGLFFQKDCPFCLGNEHMTPLEIEKIEKGDQWLIRVVPNKYPITDIHEVIIISPDHLKGICHLPTFHLHLLFQTYLRRFRTLSPLGHVLIFNNMGPLSGASIQHPHSQIVVIPKQINLDVLPLEPIKNVFLKNKQFVAYCPEFSQWAYEVWITKKSQENVDFGNLTEEEVKSLGELVQKIGCKLGNLFPDLSCNFYISPFAPWYLRIIPRLSERAGLELGTGLSVNHVEPEKAAAELARTKPL